jgi:hypothetical protein
VLSSRGWARVALAANLVGTVMLFYSFQATSSRFRLVTTKISTATGEKEEHSALCIYETNMLSTSNKGGWQIGGGPCPGWEHSKAAAVINIEQPWLAAFGFILSFMGFAIQFAAVPSTKTERQLRLEIKRLKTKARNDSN